MLSTIHIIPLNISISSACQYIERMIIGTFGPEGSYTEKAAKQWNRTGELHYYDDILDTVEALLHNEVDCSIVPVENSLEDLSRSR